MPLPPESTSPQPQSGAQNDTARQRGAQRAMDFCLQAQALWGQPRAAEAAELGKLERGVQEWARAEMASGEGEQAAQGFGEKVLALWAEGRRNFAASVQVSPRAAARVDNAGWALAIGDNESEALFGVWSGCGAASAPGATLMAENGEDIAREARRQRDSALWAWLSDPLRPESLREAFWAQWRQSKKSRNQGGSEAHQALRRAAWDELAGIWSEKSTPPSREAAEAWEGFWVGRDEVGDALAALGLLPGESPAPRSVDRFAHRDQARWASCFGKAVGLAEPTPFASEAQRHAARQAIAWMLEAMDPGPQPAHGPSGSLGAAPGRRKKAKKPQPSPEEQQHANRRGLLAQCLKPSPRTGGVKGILARLAEWEAIDPQTAQKAAQIASVALAEANGEWPAAIAAALHRKAPLVAEAIWEKKAEWGRNNPSQAPSAAAWEWAASRPWRSPEWAAAAQREDSVRWSVRWLIGHGFDLSQAHQDWKGSGQLGAFTQPYPKAKGSGFLRSASDVYFGELEALFESESMRAFMAPGSLAAPEGPKAPQRPPKRV